MVSAVWHPSLQILTTLDWWWTQVAQSGKNHLGIIVKIHKTHGSKPWVKVCFLLYWLILSQWDEIDNDTVGILLSPEDSLLYTKDTLVEPWTKLAFWCTCMVIRFCAFNFRHTRLPANIFSCQFFPNYGILKMFPLYLAGDFIYLNIHWHCIMKWWYTNY